MKAKYRVTLWEMERGWGRRHLLDRDFDSFEDAKNYRDNENDPGIEVPDYYIYASDPVLVDIDRNPPK